MMALNFDLGDPPPKSSEIAAERDRAEAERAAIQKKLIPFLIAAFVAIISLVTFQITVIVPAVRSPETSPTFLAIVALFIPYMAFILFFIANHLRHKIIENPRKALKAWIDGLEEITPEEDASLAAAIAAGELPATAGDYRRRVTALGRQLVRAELAAIKAPGIRRNPE